jgi:hypothetical protein
MKCIFVFIELLMFDIINYLITKSPGGESEPPCTLLLAHPEAILHISLKLYL